MSDKKQKKIKKSGEGRIAQMRQVYATTKENDPNLPWMMLLAALLPPLVVVLIAALTGAGILSWILWILTGILGGVLGAMFILGRRAERSAYQQIEGKPGAVGAVVSSALKGSYRGSQTPVAIVPRTNDAVYRVIGKGGVILVSEGDERRVQRLVQEQKRAISRMLPVTITHIHVGRGEGQVPLPKLVSRIKKVKKTLRRAEVQAVYQRLASLQREPVGIPKGIDPLKVRRSSKPR